MGNEKKQGVLKIQEHVLMMLTCCILLGNIFSQQVSSGFSASGYAGDLIIYNRTPDRLALMDPNPEADPPQGILDVFLTTGNPYVYHAVASDSENRYIFQLVTEHNPNLPDDPWFYMTALDFEHLPSIGRTIYLTSVMNRTFGEVGMAYSRFEKKLYICADTMVDHCVRIHIPTFAVDMLSLPSTAITNPSTVAIADDGTDATWAMIGNKTVISTVGLQTDMYYWFYPYSEQECLGGQWEPLKQIFVVLSGSSSQRLFLRFYDPVSNSYAHDGFELPFFLDSDVRPSFVVYPTAWSKNASLAQEYANSTMIWMTTSKHLYRIVVVLGDDGAYNYIWRRWPWSAGNQPTTSLAYVRQAAIIQPEHIQDSSTLAQFGVDSPVFTILSNLSGVVETTVGRLGDFVTSYGRKFELPASWYKSQLRFMVPQFTTADGSNVTLYDQRDGIATYAFTYMENLLPSGPLAVVSALYNPETDVTVGSPAGVQYRLERGAVKYTINLQALFAIAELFHNDPRATFNWTVCYTSDQKHGKFSLEPEKERDDQLNIARYKFTRKGTDALVLNVLEHCEVDGRSIEQVKHRLSAEQLDGGRFQACIYFQFPAFNDIFSYDPDFGVVLDGDNGRDGDGNSEYIAQIAVPVVVGSALLVGLGLLGAVAVVLVIAYYRWRVVPHAGTVDL